MSLLSSLCQCNHQCVPDLCQSALSNCGFSICSVFSFKALTEDIDIWWDKEYSTIKRGKVVLEPELGKPFYEDWGNGNGTVVGIVTYVEKNKVLEIEGPIGMDKPAQGLLRFELVPQGQTTLLKFTHRAIGIVRSYAIHVFAQGWKNLFEVRLPAYLEQHE